MKKSIAIILSIVLFIILVLPVAAFTTVKVTGIKVNVSSITLNVGDSQNARVIFSPLNTTQKRLVCVSANSKVATVSALCVVTGVSVGSTTVTVTSYSNKALALKIKVKVLKKDALLGIPGQLPIVKKPFTLRILTNQGSGFQQVPSADLLAYKTVGKLTGITVKYESAPFAEMAEVLTTRLAANIDLPDIISMCTPQSATNAGITMSDIFSYGENGTLAELTPALIEKNAPGLADFYANNTDAKVLRTSNAGKMYSVPDSIQYRKEWQIAFLINEPWLKKLNLNVPTTTDELFNVLMAFKTKDPNGNNIADEIPMINLWSTLDYMGDSWDLQSIENQNPAAFGFARHDNGTVTNDLTDPRMKDYFSYLHKLYVNGLLDKEFSVTTPDTLSAKVKADRVGSWIEWDSYSTIYDMLLDPKFGNPVGTGKITFPVIKQPKAAPQYSAHRLLRPSSSGDWAITADCKRPDIALRFLDAILFNQKLLDLHIWGVEGVTYKVVNGEKERIPEKVPTEFAKMGFGQWSLPNVQGGWDIGASPIIITEKANNRTIVDIEPFPIVTPTKAETDVMTKYQADLKSYFSEARAKFITGDMPLSDFSKYVSEINKRGAKELQAVYTAQLKRALASMK